MYFLIEAILDDEKPVPVQLKKKKAFLAKFVADDEKKQRGLLNALELYATDTNTDAYKIFAAILNALYELDLCEENAFANGSTSFVRLKSSASTRKLPKPFVNKPQVSLNS